MLAAVKNRLLVHERAAIDRRYHEEAIAPIDGLEKLAISPVTNQAAAGLLCLPVCSGLTAAQKDHIVDLLPRSLA